MARSLVHKLAAVAAVAVAGVSLLAGTAQAASSSDPSDPPEPYIYSAIHWDLKTKNVSTVTCMSPSALRSLIGTYSGGQVLGTTNMRTHRVALSDVDVCEPFVAYWTSDFPDYPVDVETLMRWSRLRTRPRTYAGSASSGRRSAQVPAVP
jgi:hypothetical protein